MEIKKLSQMVPTIRVVEGYNPFEHLASSQDIETGRPELTIDEDEKYLPSVEKVKWFWAYCEERNFNGSIIPYVEVDEKGRVSAYCEIRFDSASEKPIASGYALKEVVPGEKYSSPKAAETIAIGNALNNAGFGCEVAAYLKALKEQFISEEKAENEKLEAEIDESVRKALLSTAETMSETKKKATKTSAKEKAEKPVTEHSGQPEEHVETEEPSKKESESVDIHDEESVKEVKEKTPVQEDSQISEEKKLLTDDFALTKEDLGNVPTVRHYVGMKVSELSPSVKSLLKKNFSAKLSERLLEAL